MKLSFGTKTLEFGLILDNALADFEQIFWKSEFLTTSILGYCLLNVSWRFFENLENLKLLI